MSNEIIQEEGNNNRNYVDRLSLREELKAIERGRATSLWYNPAKSWEKSNLTETMVSPQTVYRGERNGKPTWEEPVVHLDQYIDGIKRVKSAATSDVYEAVSDPFIGEWQEIGKEYFDAHKNGRLKSAAVGTDADFSAIDVVNVLAEMVATELRTFVLEQALTVIGTPQLDLKVDLYTRFTAEQAVPEGVAPISKRASVSRTSYDLTKDVSMIGITDEAQLRTVHDMYKQQVDTAVTDFKRLKSNKIAAQLATANSNTTSDWTAFANTGAADHNNVDPRQAIGTVSDIIFANNGAPNVIASHDKTWRGFVSSTFIKGVLQAVPLPDMSMAKVINQVPSMPGYTWYVDNEMTSNTAVVFDRKAVALIQGPVRTAQYRLEQEGIDGYIYRDWNLPIFLVSNRVQLLTPTN